MAAVPVSEVPMAVAVATKGGDAGDPVPVAVPVARGGQQAMYEPLYRPSYGGTSYNPSYQAEPVLKPAAFVEPSAPPPEDPYD
jgi:hypothetical protein